MKKVILSIAVIALSTSCLKEYTCECEQEKENVNGTIVSSNTFHEASKKEAKNFCEGGNVYEEPNTTICKLK